MSCACQSYCNEVRGHYKQSTPEANGKEAWCTPPPAMQSLLPNTSHRGSHGQHIAQGVAWTTHRTGSHMDNTSHRESHGQHIAQGVAWTTHRTGSCMDNTSHRESHGQHITQGVAWTTHHTGSLILHITWETHRTGSLILLITWVTHRMSNASHRKSHSAHHMGNTLQTCLQSHSEPHHMDNTSHRHVNLTNNKNKPFTHLFCVVSAEANNTFVGSKR